MSPKPNHPARLTDDQLLAYIEEALDASAAATVERALRGNPSLERRVLAMRHDRAALMQEFASDHDHRAPLDLAAVALESVERSALLNSGAGSRAPAARPSPTLRIAPGIPEEWNSNEFSRLPQAPPAIARPKPPAVWRFISSRPLASAAALALLVGGTAIVASLVTRTPARDARLSGNADLALSSPSPADIAAQRSLKESVDLAIADKGAPLPSENLPDAERTLPVNIASADDSRARSGETPAGTGNGADVARVDPAEREEIATGPTPPNAPVTITTERAAQLLTENRLAVRVVPRSKSDPAKLNAGLAALAKRDSSRAWKLTTSTPPEVAASVLAQLDRKSESSADPASRQRRSDPRDPAGDIERAIGSTSGQNSASQTGRSESTPRPALTGSPVRPPLGHATVYHSEIPASAAALASLRAALDRAGNADIVYEELSAPTTITPTISEPNVIWWTQPATTWVRRSTVPIIVELSQ